MRRQDGEKAKKKTDRRGYRWASTGTRHNVPGGKQRSKKGGYMKKTNLRARSKDFKQGRIEE